MLSQQSASEINVNGNGDSTADIAVNLEDSEHQLCKARNISTISIFRRRCGRSRDDTTTMKIYTTINYYTGEVGGEIGMMTMMREFNAMERRRGNKECKKWTSVEY